MEWEKLNKLSLEELELKASELYGKANYRIARLGRKRGESSAYEKLKSYIGSPYLQEREYLKFEIPKTENTRQKMNQLIQSIGVAEKFLSSETSTAKGIERVKRNRRKWVRKNFDGFNTNEEADDFLNFLGSSEIQEQKQIFDSNIIVEAIATASKNQPSKKLQEIYRDFKASGKSWGGFIIEQEREYKSKRGINF
jgi:hypothetical protein|nr:MAG TPA_asm: hypothetical protein [Caudoviricetes sp.]